MTDPTASSTAGDAAALAAAAGQVLTPAQTAERCAAVLAELATTLSAPARTADTDALAEPAGISEVRE